MTLPISPDLQRLIADQAQSLGFTSLEEYLRTVFGKMPPETHSIPISDDEFARILAELSADDNLPALPTDFSRADIYAEHD